MSWAWAIGAIHWTVRIWAIWAVPRRRSPNAARAWLLLILLQPLVGLLFYAFFGRAYLPADRKERQKRANRYIREVRERFVGGGPVTIDREPTARLAERLGAFPPTSGNRVELIDHYDAAIDRIIADVDQARTSVGLLFYIFEPDPTGRRVADAVKRAAARGVTCSVMMDGMASAPGLKKLGPELRAAGVEVISLLTPGAWSTRRDLRNHRKIAVIDGRIAHTGSQNIVDSYDYKGRKLTYEELMVRMEGPVVRGLEAVFLTDWHLETGREVDDTPLVEPVPTAGEVTAQVLPSGPTYEVENNERTFVQMLYGARERIVVTSPYFVPDRPFVEALQAAAARGLDVNVVTPKQADQMLVRLAQESFYDELLAAGVKIHLYRPRFLHAKHISVDGDLCAIGSSNIDMRSFTLNEEVMALFYDRGVAADLARVQERYFRDSDLLDREEWRRRSPIRRTAQQMARLVDSLL